MQALTAQQRKERLPLILWGLQERIAMRLVKLYVPRLQRVRKLRTMLRNGSAERSALPHAPPPFLPRSILRERTNCETCAQEMNDK